MTRKKKKEEIYNDSWIYILLLSTLVILIESLKTYSFSLKGVNITYSVLLLPLIYFITNYITKKFDYKKSVGAVCLSGAALVIYYVLINFALGRTTNFMNISGEFFGYIMSQFINLLIYTFILDNTKQPYLLIFLGYIFSLVVFYMFYTLIYLNLIILDGFWSKYFMIIGIQLILCLPLTFIDKKIKRGLEE